MRFETHSPRTPLPVSSARPSSAQLRKARRRSFDKTLLGLIVAGPIAFAEYLIRLARAAGEAQALGRLPGVRVA